MGVVSLVRGQFGFGFGSCDNVLSTCLNPLFKDIETIGDNNETLCTSVDDAIACVAQAIPNCDPLTKANIINVVFDVAGIYEATCTLNNTNDSAFKDPCANDLAYCNSINFQAEYATPTSAACGLFDKTIECMERNTSHCGINAIAIISMSIRNVTAKMNSEPFFCSEREDYDIAGCEAGFYNCVNPLSQLYIAGTENGPSTEVCSNVTSFMQCVVTNNAKCSPRLVELNNENANNITNIFHNDPFNCPRVTLVTTTTSQPTLPSEESEKTASPIDKFKTTSTSTTTTTTTIIPATQSSTTATTATTEVPIAAAPTTPTTTATPSTTTAKQNVEPMTVPVKQMETITVNPNLKQFPSKDNSADDFRKGSPAMANRNQNVLDKSHENKNLDDDSSNQNGNEDSGLESDRNADSKFASLKGDATTTQKHASPVWLMTMLLSLLLI